MEKILVDGVMGDRRGRPLWLRRARSQEGQIAVGEKVVIAWGKSKRTFNAKVIDVGDGVHSPEIPRQVFAFELVDPALPTWAVNLPGPSQLILRAQEEDSSIALLIDNLHNLAHTVSVIVWQRPSPSRSPHMNE